MPKMTVRVILKSGVEFSIKCDKFTLTRNGFQQVTGYNIEGITAARYSAIRLTDARSASGFKRLSRKRGGGIRLFYLSQHGQTQHIFTITFTGKRKSASCAGGYGSRTTTGTPPIPRPSLQW